MIAPFRLFFIVLVVFFCKTKAQTTLPAGVLSFIATDLQNKGKVKVQWVTSFEKNIKEFLVFRSVDQTNWYVVANMSAKNTSHVSNYEFIDGTGSGGINYYKLEALSPAGERTVLKFTKVDLEDMDKVVRIFPDAVAGQIRVESAEQISSIELELTDILDRNYRIDFVRDNTHQITLVTGPLTPGVYYLKCYLNKNRYVRKKALII